MNTAADATRKRIADTLIGFFSSGIFVEKAGIITIRATTQSTMPASEQRARIVEEDALMRARKPEPEEGENEEENEEDDPICQTTLKHG